MTAGAVPASVELPRQTEISLREASSSVGNSARDRATSTDQVDAFHAAGLAAGGTDDGAPGPRPDYHEHYYGAFLVDPDGNRVQLSQEL